jgi:hypothetical protein
LRKNLIGVYRYLAKQSGCYHRIFVIRLFYQGNDMNDKIRQPPLSPELAAILDTGFAIWAGESVNAALRGKFDSRRIPVVGVRQVRVWGLQVDDERELPGLERTQIPDEEVWEVNLEAKDGSKYEFDSTLLKPAPAN